MEKIERELQWRIEEELEERKSFVMHNSHKALQIELLKRQTDKEKATTLDKKGSNILYINYLGEKMVKMRMRKKMRIV